MAVIYGLNYLGSSLVGPTWACAPGMQTGGLQCPWGGRRKEWGAHGRRQPPWRRCESHPWESRCTDCLLELGTGYPGTLCKEEWKGQWLWSLAALGLNSAQLAV